MIDARQIETPPAALAPEVKSEVGLASRPFETPFLRTLVFVGGFASIGVELAASRLLAPYFGSSTFIWAALIGVTLAFLSLGYFLGGRVADRRPQPELLYALAAIAAVAIGTIPFVARPLLGASLDAFRELDAGAFYASLAGTLLLLAPPVTLLGFISPFAIRLQIADVASAGQTAGTLYALSTIGSISGSFIPILVLIPLIGTAATFAVLSLSLLVPAVAGLVRLRLRPVALSAAAAALTIPALAMAAPQNVRPADRGVLLDERESAYNYIQVVEQDGRRLLILNEGHAVHSVYDPEELLTGGPWDYFMIAPLFADGRRETGDGSRESAKPRDALLIGLAGGTAARQLTAAYGPIPIVGVEIDPAIDDVARDYFALDELGNVESVIADGRYALKTSDRDFDLIGVDAYRQPYIPFQLTSREFFHEVSDHLRPGGVVVVNAGRTTTDYRLVDALSTTMRDVFPYVLAVDVARYANTMLIASQTPLSEDALVRNMEQLPASSPLREVATWSLDSGNIRGIQPGGFVFTDDRAPVELVIDQMILDAARELTAP